MRPHPRIRKFFKWGGAVVSVLLLAVLLVSGWYEARSGDIGQWGGMIRWGVIQVYHAAAPARPPERAAFLRPNMWSAVTLFPRTYAPAPFTLSWRFGWYYADSFTTRSLPAMTPGSWAGMLTIPLWAPTTLAAAIAGIAWRLDRRAAHRAKLGACPKCSYSRTGLARSAVCPECGSPAPVAAPPG